MYDKIQRGWGDRRDECDTSSCMKLVGSADGGVAIGVVENWYTICTPGALILLLRLHLHHREKQR